KEEETRQYVQSSLGFLRAGAATVSIVHHTAIEYLFDENRQDGPPTLPKGEFDLKVSWECFRYFHHAFAYPEKSPIGNGDAPHDSSQESSPERDSQEKSVEAPSEVARKAPQEVAAQWPYLRYAAESWFIHARRNIEIPDHEFWEDSTRNWLEHQFFDTSDT